MSALALLCAATDIKAAQPVVLHTEDHGLIVELTGLERPERINHMHGLELSIATTDGKPVTGASIVLTGQRLYALNPLPTSPRALPEETAGRYRVEGLRFHMAGEWRLVFRIESAQIRDQFTLNVVVK